MADVELFVIGIIIGLFSYQLFISTRKNTVKYIPRFARAKWTKELTWKAFTPDSFEWLVADILQLKDTNV